jgi:hypothetical protein
MSFVRYFEPFVVKNFYQFKLSINFTIMESKFLLLLPALFGIMTICSSQVPDHWSGWDWLTGNWVGEGGGQPGQGSGTFSFSFDLDSNILVRKSHSEYPATSGNRTVIHDDLMIVYLNQEGAADRAVYFDNEGHTIFYSVSFKENYVILTSENSGNTPVFRLVYERLDNETVNTRFEMSQDGQKFQPYVEGKSKRMNKP